MTDSVRSVGLRSAIALIAANMIGAGVFTTSGFALADLGRPEFVLLAWVVGGVIALCGALSYAGLALHMPDNGGEYLFLSRALHPMVGFLAGWVSLLAGFTAPIAVAAHGFEAYAEAALGLGWPPGLLGAGAILICGLAHGLSRSNGLRIQDLAVAIKLAAIVLFILFGAATLGSSPGVERPDSAALPAFELSAFAVTLVWISFAYSGWNAVVYIAGEIEEPQRVLPRALALATGGVALVYVGLNAVFLWSAPVSALAGHAEVGAISAQALGGDHARVLLSGVVMLGLLTSVSAMVMVGPRVYARMATDGLLPRVFLQGGEEPRGAIAMQVVLALLAFLLADLRELLDYVGFLLGLSAATTVACLFLPALRVSAAARVVGFPVVPIIFIAMTLGSSAFLVYSEPLESAIGVGTLVVGLGVYFAMNRGRPSR